nr:hypothetical protein [Actinospica acidiphila]
MHPVPGGVNAVGELPQHLTPLGHEVVATQPCRPHSLRRHVPASLELVEVRADRRRGQLLRGLQVLAGGIARVQRGGRLRELVRERGGFLDLLVEGHDRTQVVRRRVLQKCGLQQRQAPAPPCLPRLPEDGEGVVDLEDVDLEPGQDPRSIASESPSSAPGSQAPKVPSGSSAMLAISTFIPAAPFCGRGEARMRGVAVR